MNWLKKDISLAWLIGQKADAWIRYNEPKLLFFALIATWVFLAVLFVIHQSTTPYEHDY